MATRTAYLDFKESGTDATRAKVISLAEAQATVKRRTQELAPVFQQSSAAGGMFERVMAAATGRAQGLTGALGPLGTAMSSGAARTAAHALTLTQWAAASERASFMGRMLNTTVLAGGATMAAASVAIMAHAGDVVRAGDSYQALQSRINATTKSMEESAAVEARIYAQAAETRTRVDDQLRLYTRLDPAMKENGWDNNDSLRISSLVAKGIAVGGATTPERQAAIGQFAQALGSGTLGGDELKTMREAAPQLLRFMSQNLEINGKIGVSFGQLKKLGAEGELTTQRIVEALLRAGPAIDAAFVKAPKDAQAQFDVLKDTIARAVGELAVTSGVQGGLFNWLENLTKKADAFREKMAMDPEAVGNIREAAEFVGDAVGTIADLGAGAVRHFDLIVTAGQAVIGLKLGTVFADWFRAAAQGARGAIGDFQAFTAAARQQASLIGSGTQIQAAGSTNEVAQAMKLRATELQQRADLQAAEAAAAKAAADRAAASAADMRALHGAKAAATVEAEAIANQQAALATKMAEQAKRADTAAAGAAAAASARLAIAKEAEAIATTRVTGRMMAQTVAMRALTGLYAMMGGAIGIASVAIVGALALIAHHTAQARKEAEDYKRGLELMAELAVETKSAAEGLAGAVDEAAAASDRAAGASRRHAAALAEERKEIFLAMMAAQGKRIQQAEGRLSDATMGGRFGVNAAAKQKAEDELTLMRTGLADMQTQYNLLATKGTGTGRKGSGARGGGPGEIAGPGFRGGYRPPEKGPETEPKGGSTRTARVSVPGPVNRAAFEDLVQEFLPKAGRDRFSYSAGGVSDVTTGGAFKARSEDEARAAAEYVKQIEAINAATDKQIALTGKSRDELRQAASARLNYAVTTSQAAQAEDRWLDIKAEMEGASRAQIKAEREVQDLQAKGAEITKEQTDAYIAFIVAREKAGRLSAAVSFNAPIARQAADQVLAGSVIPVDGRGVADVEKATRQLMAAKERIVLELEDRIRTETKRQVDAGELTQVEGEKRLADRIGQVRTSAEIELQERLLDIRRQATEDDARHREERYAETADSIVGALRDVGRGGDPAEIGKQLADDLLQAMYDELIYNPLRQAIIDLLRATMSPTGTVGGGGLGGFVGDFLGAIFGGMGGRTSGGGASGGASIVDPRSYGGTPVPWMNYADGGVAAGRGLFRGRGGPREDKNTVNVSDGEFIVNARDTRRNFALLTAINSGMMNQFYPAFADGGLVGRSITRASSRLLARDIDDGGGIGAAALAPIIVVNPPAPQAGGGDIHIHNYSKARVEEQQEADGSRRLNIYDQVGKGLVSAAGASGDLKRASRATPRHTKRG